MAKQESRGDYKKQSLPENTQRQRVTMWRKRIKQAKEDLMIAARVANAREADRFLGGAKVVPTKGKGRSKVYLNYALPLLEELHRGSVPAIPNPVVEARTEAAAPREQATQRFLNFLFDKNEEDILNTMDDIQWDDDKMGAAVVRVDWQQKTVNADPVSDVSQENADVQVRKAEEENADQTLQTITDSDLDLIHLQQHEAFLAQIEIGTPEYESLTQHIREHTARLSVITQEGVRVSRVRNDRYFYDQYHGWKDRAWECELKFARVRFLLENGYKNVTPDNAPPRQSNEAVGDASSFEDGSMSYDDRTIAIYEIHDRLNHREIVIAADGPEEGLPLMERQWRYGNLDIYKLKPFHKFEPSLSWGEPLMHVMIPILDRLAIVDYYIDRHVQNHANTKIFVPAQAGANGIKKNIKDPNTVFVPTPAEAIAGIKTFEPPAIPSTLLEQRSSLMNNLRRAVGLDAQDTGASNPHAVTATESFARSQAGAGRIEDRQKVITEFLSWIGEMSLKLYKEFAMMATEISVNTELGLQWQTIEPRDLPVDINISFDIESVTDKGRAEMMAKVDRVVQTASSMPIPIDYDKLFVWAMKEMGLKRPDQFRAPGTPGPEHMLGMQGQPGVEGSSQAPVGTALNTRAQAEFAPGPSDAKAAAEASGQA